jgi:signal transduction histidine kinase
MSMIRQQSIKKQLIGISMATTAAALFMAVFLLSAYELIMFKRSLVDNLSSQARIIGFNSAAALAFNAPKDAEETLSALRASPNIIDAVIYRGNGEMFVRYQRDGRKEPYAPPTPGSADRRLSFDRMSIMQPIVVDGETIGSLFIRSDIMQLKSRILWSGAGIIVVLFCVLPAAYLLLSRLQRRITEPIYALAQLTETVTGERNYSLRTSIYRQDELGILSKGFNAMLEQIQKRDAELEAHRRRLEQEVAERTAELKRSNDALQQFAYIASHDLQEPLRKVAAFGDRLKTKFSGVLDAQGRDYLERMQAAAGRMSTLITDLLAYSRITTKAQPIVPIDLAGVVREVLSDLEVRLEQTGGRVEVGDLPLIDADPLQMRQLFQNLIGNGLKFHKPGEAPVLKVSGRIVSGRPDDREAGALLEITVEDNGIGFDEKYLDRIFEVFQRLHGRSEYDGTGIGLAVCRKIVERHRGTITAKSAPGRGSAFIVTLPVGRRKGDRDNGSGKQNDNDPDGG